MSMVFNGPVFDRNVVRMSIGFAMHWQKSIGSREDMESAFEELRDLVNARSVLHVRQSRGSRESYSAARGEPSAGKLFSRPSRSFARAVLGENLHSARAGQVWFVSQTKISAETLAEMQAAAIADVAIIPLENRPACSDFLEIVFSATVPDHDRTLLEMLCPAIAEGWQVRNPGSVSAMMAGRPSRVAQARAASADKPILDMDNPAGLTRSEFQVCVLIHEGRLPEDIAKTLKVKKSTLRSHMRSIYNKTGVSGQVELVHRLHGAVAAV